MKKVKLKLTRREVENLMQMIEMVLECPGNFDYTNDRQDKLILALLGEIYEKLRIKLSPYEKQFKITLSVAQSYALLIHALLPVGTLPPGTDITINSILTNVDKQTL